MRCFLRSESVYGVGNLTHTAYANQRMTLNSEIAKISSSKAEYGVRATCVITRGVFIIYVLERAFGDALN